MITLSQFGAGRIGKIHASNVARSARARLKYVVDVDEAAAQALAKAHGAVVADAETVFADADVDAVIVASSTDTHKPLVEAACTAGKAVFCEKPVDLDSARVKEVVRAVEKAGVLFFVAFNRRFDPNFSALHKALRAGRIGKVEQVIITSRDPGPPPASYIKVSGGLFRDMMIHDLDMARWLLAEEPTEVFAVGSCLVDPAIGKLGDVDTAAVTLTTASGAICQITNSRRAVYGYDQRIEVFGAGGMLRAGNRTDTTVEVSDGTGVMTDKPMFFFLERYADAYRIELDHFLDCLEKKATPMAGVEDGLRSLLLADAAAQSLKTGRPVKQ
ncbi:inositol 2-dehydrogenase [Shumkonia mesophila]|uniref:inositol 2-dehydrogenase n=1 Tax=Shumkonia mesophila TaxID=2838854 RepID=UPI002934B50E|nr:inositol 2-dehydrogenase [Shumkonia mesophila]